AAIPAQFVHANPQVRADEGKIALVKGPLVYCLEEIDNGKNLSSILAKGNQKVEEKRSSGKADGMQLKFNGVSIDPSEWKEDELYRPGNVRLKERELTAVPYFRWGNRKAGEMTVWIKELLR
ncbi:MAG TPA: glycoside hydrolase family 127 protein, partial [Lachnospiraceae bacterium]|nr:glycoside hydrolase family 127 protein [Lachnospiraceae bacterium]